MAIMLCWCIAGLMMCLSNWTSQPSSPWIRTLVSLNGLSDFHRFFPYEQDGNVKVKEPWNWKNRFYFYFWAHHPSTQTHTTRYWYLHFLSNTKACVCIPCLRPIASYCRDTLYFSAESQMSDKLRPQQICEHNYEVRDVIITFQYWLTSNSSLALERKRNAPPSLIIYPTNNS